MELKDRIANIKTILPYCSGRSDEVKIVVDEVGEFFANLFNNDDRFKHSGCDRIFPRVFLSKSLNTDYKTHSTTIGLEYVYDFDRDGYYTARYYFNDEDLEDTCFGMAGAIIEYSEIPDNIWSIIQDELYENARKNVTDNLISATKQVGICTDRVLEFSNIKLCPSLSK